jgi:hypothetical protein
MTTPFSQLFIRKIISAAIATFLFSIIYAWFVPTFSFSNTLSIGENAHEAFKVICVFMLYAAPVIYLYGTAASLISDLIARSVSHRQWIRITVSALSHCIFGLILGHISFLAAILFFIFDVLRSNRKKPYTWNITLASPLLPISLWLMSVAYVNLNG